MLSKLKMEDALKNFYLPEARLQINRDQTEFSKRIGKNPTLVEGSKFVAYLRYGRNGGIAALSSDDATLPKANSRKGLQVKADTKNLFGVIEVTSKAMKASRTEKGAYIQALASEIKDLTEDIKDTLSRQMYGNGKGTIGIVKAATTSSTTLVVKAGSYSNEQDFGEGMLIDVLSANGSAVAEAAVEVINVAIDDATGDITLTLGKAVTAAINGLISLQSSYGNEITGLNAIYDSAITSVWGVSKAAHSFFNPIKRTFTSSVNVKEIVQLKTDANRKTGAKVDMLLAGSDVYSDIQEILTATRQWNNTMKLDGGVEVLAIDGLPIINDKFQSDDRFDMVSTETFSMPSLGDWDWMDQDGAVLKFQGKAGYTAVIEKYTEMFCDRPSANARITK